MSIIKPDIDKIITELRFSTSRSSGPGGQSVNKVNTKVTLRWDVVGSTVITVDQREIILAKLNKVINQEGEVVLSSESSRSQLQNKENVSKKLAELLNKAFTVPKKRKPTKPTKASVLKRLGNKKHHSEKKKRRRDID